MSHIELQSVEKWYGQDDPSLAVSRVHALHEINLTIQQGESVAIVGASGAGKSTLMHIIGCLDRPSSGQYYFLGQDVARLDDDTLSVLRNRSIGFVFQSFYLLPRLTVLENVGLPLHYRGLSFECAKQQAELMLDQLAMSEYSQRYPYQLSGGQQQRVAIARALVGDASLLVADEPTGALDSETGQIVMDVLHHLNQSQGTTLVVVTHESTVAKQCQRIVRLKDGHIDSDSNGGAS